MWFSIGLGTLTLVHILTVYSDFTKKPVLLWFSDSLKIWSGWNLMHFILSGKDDKIVARQEVV